MNLQVDVNNQIKLPKDMSAESVGTVITKVMVGSPLHPLYLYLEQVSSYADTDEVKGETPDMESMMSLYKTICVPMAMKELEETIKKICAVYHIPEIKIQKNDNTEKGRHGYLN